MEKVDNDKITAKDVIFAVGIVAIILSAIIFGINKWIKHENKKEAVALERESFEVSGSIENIKLERVRGQVGFISSGYYTLAYINVNDKEYEVTEELIEGLEKGQYVTLKGRNEEVRSIIIDKK